MNHPAPEPTFSEILTTLRAVRFVFVVIVLGLAYFNIRFSFSLGQFQDIWAGMGVKLPPLTVYILAVSPFLKICSLLFPFLALLSSRHRNLARSFYLIGGVIFLTIVQLIFLYKGISAPLFDMISNLSGGA